MKRISVESSHASLRKILSEYNIPLVKKTFGTKIVRVCCRTIDQIKNIPLIIKELIQCNLIKEIGMPLEYAYKMKSLLLFLKPVNVQLHKKLDHVFEEHPLKFYHLVIDVEYSTVAANEILKKKLTKDIVAKTDMKITYANVKKKKEIGCMKNCHLINTVQGEKNKTLIIELCTLGLHFVALIGILILIFEESTN